MSDSSSPLDLAFAQALGARDYAEASLLLDSGASINRVLRREEYFDRDLVEETSTYLIDASAEGDISRMEFLLERGADLNIARSHSGTTALLAAMRYGHTAAVDLLLAQGADVHAVDLYNRKDAIAYATEGVNVSFVRSLLQAGAPARFDKLNFSVKGGVEAREVIQLLLDHGGDINRIDSWGRTPLMWAAQYAEAETVRLMLDRGADPNRISEANMNGVRSNETALGLARKSRRDDIVAVLRQGGAVLNAPSVLARLWHRVTG